MASGLVSNYPNGWADGVTVRGMPVLNSYPGNVFWVDSTDANASNGNPGTFQQPFATIDGAINQCTASNGDLIMVKAGHAETLVASGAITMDVAGISIIGLGTGNNRPVLTFTPAATTTANIVWSAANCSFENIVCIAGLDAISKPFNISGSGAWLDIEWQDASSLIEAETVVLTTAAADNLTINLTYRGFPAGNACVAPIKLVGATDARINLDFYGIASTAVVNFITTLSSNVVITGYAYNSTDTTGAKLVVDTVTGSLWAATIFAGAAGASFSGGSGAALAADDVSAVAALLVAPTADSTATTNMRDSVGIKTDASVYVPGTTKSVVAYSKGTADLQEKVVKKAAATIVNGQTLFTVAGGPIMVIGLASICETANDGTASTLQYNATPTSGSATTISAASASLASAAAGASVTLAGTALATAALLNAGGPNLIANPGTILVPAGVITAVVAVGSTTGTWAHYLRYRPLATGVTVT